MSGSGDSFLKGFIFGSLVGGIAGVLLAPKSGREMREELSEEAEKIYAHTRVDLENARKAAMKSFEEGRDKIIEKMKSAKDETAGESVIDESIVEEEKPQKSGRKSRAKRDT